MGTYEEQDVARRRFDVADAVPLLLDAQGAVISWTRDAQRLLHYAASEVVGTRVAGLLTAEDAARVPELAERCRRDGGWSGLLTVRRKGGGQVRVMARVTPAAEPGGSPRWLVLLSDMADARGWDMSREVLEQMVTGSPVGIAIVDTTLRCVWSNTALEQFGGGSPAERLGRRVGEIQPGLDPAGMESQMRHVLETGEPVFGYEQVGHVRSAPHRETAHMLSFTRLEDEQGRPMGVYYTVVDITDRHRARQRLALLDRAGERIGRSLDIVQTAQELADVAVPDCADFVSVDLLESVLHGAELASGPLSSSELVPLRRSGQQSVNPGVPEAVVQVGGVARYLAGSPPIRCLTTGTSWREERLDPLATTWATDMTDGRAATFLELGLHSVMIVPIRARGVTLGVTTFFRRRRQEPFDDDDLSLAEDLVSRAAVCVDNARRYTRERDAALVLQRSLLPRRLPEQNAVDVAACYRPADELTGLGGDWYDLIPLSGARVALVVGEVPGHGIDAAAAMGRLRTAVRTLAALDLPPEEVLAHLDDLAARTSLEEGAAEDDDVQVSGSACVYVVYDPVDGQCTMAAAGHPAPAVVLPDGTVSFVDLPQGTPLGTGGPPFEAVELALAEGSTLALHTDGLLAREDHDWAVDADRERLRRALELVEPSLDLRCRAVVDALVPARPHDDVALLMARTRLLGAEQVADWDLPADPAVVADARKEAARQLAAWDLDELAFTTELVVSELVTNAIRYASGPIRLRLIKERALICEVSDGGATAPHLRHPRATDEGGRGLLLVSQFSRRWGTRFVPEGKVIWAEQSLEESPA
ncbi:MULTISPECIES: SpoIIE family protein phosphatase [Streptomyces]|uniref:SpoIIE family protein phosphatase n=1 Tax=Streptomyces TaxID=1883 RepID=UPI000D35DE4F|nr:MULTISPECIES: SpoIIE family protein phosphatase [Streptomyces]MBY8338657.1 SpoIIE family protein phosphatase [Streptomyces plumbidurans]PTM96980.1 PAS domain S-box-containing protein [Streptomyces sp. VMFN-G11Ma]